MKRKFRILSAVLAAALTALPLTAAINLTAYAAGSADIGCYEYGYSSAKVYTPPADDYNPSVYGESPSAVFYVSPGGSDTAGNGSADKPWATIGFAAGQVTAPGSVIRLAAGRWVVNSCVNIAPGVSLEGAGATGAAATVITSTALTAEFNNAIINLVSGSVVNGAQHISSICFDGGDMTATQALEIRNRNNVSVHDCVFVDFNYLAVGWRSGSWSDIPNSMATAPDAIPGAWVSGGRFYSNTVTNCARYDSYARGALFCGGLSGFRIYNNNMTESNILADDGSIQTIRGVPIKFWYYDGWMLDCKIYNNIISKLNNPVSGSDGNGWPFAIESMCHYQLEICGNDFVGAIDLNYGFSGEYDGFKGYKASGDSNNTVYDYATWIHDNSIHAQGSSGWEQNAIILEYDTEKTIIERNKITDCASALYFTPRAGCVISDVTFRYNSCTDIRFTGGSYADAVRIDGWDTGFTLNNFAVHNNLFLCQGIGGYGIMLAQNGAYTGNNINISNNILSGFTYNPLVIQRHSSISSLTVKNNLFYNNGGWNGVDSSSTTGNITNTAAITNYVNSGNTLLNAAGWSGLFADAANGDYRLKEGSAAIDAGSSFGALTDLNGNTVPFNGDSPAQQLATPSSLSWSGTSASWSIVLNASGYQVEVFKNSVAVGSPGQTAAASFDCANIIAQNGCGSYTFRVTAIGSGSYSNSAASALSQAYPAVHRSVVDDPGIPPTCTETGKTAGSHCSACSEVIVAQADISALGHSYGGWHLGKGLLCRTCSACGNSVSIFKVIADWFASIFGA